MFSMSVFISVVVAAKRQDLRCCRDLRFAKLLCFLQGFHITRRVYQRSKQPSLSERVRIKSALAQALSFFLQLCIGCQDNTFLQVHFVCSVKW